MRQLFRELSDVGSSVFPYGNMIRYDRTLMNLTINYFVLGTKKR